MPSSFPISAEQNSQPSMARFQPTISNISARTASQRWRRPEPWRYSLPGAFYFLRETKLPPVAALREAGVPIAIATDCNPGSSPLASILLTLNMACTLFRLTPEEALAGVTREAARALGMHDETGTIEPGKRADLAVWDVKHPAELAYRIGFNPLYRRITGDIE